MSTVKKGNEFRDAIFRALLAASYRNVETEKRIGGYKKVDIYYEEVDFGRVRKVAVEAKNYEKPLVKSEVATKIHAEYQPLIANKDIDKLVIIAPHDVSPDTREFISSCGYVFMTIEQFYAYIMNFLGYLEGLRTGYKEGGLDKYYMPLLFGDGEDLEQYLDRWLVAESAKPIAVLAGYGMGKTSFSKHYACKLAGKFLDNEYGRIPIYIRLGEISDEQSLEGLLAKCLTSSNAVQNYTFELFMELNRNGQFCILLDGFDEMKHAMTWDHFKHNVKQLNRLIEGDSKVVLLGRPSAFTSESEQALILRGVRPIDEKEVRAFEWNIYERIELNLFTEDAAFEFIGKYIKYLIVANDVGCNQDVDDFVESRISEIKGLGFSDIILRPVQAKMLAEIASDPSHQLESYSRYGLYKHFMDCIIEREMLKQSRQLFSSETRRSFVRELAWWMWGSGTSTGLSLSEIPSWIIEKCKGNRVMDRDGALRDLVSGSVLETKIADKFYFPHRSYQEFLVSEYVVNLAPDAGVIDKIRSVINREILDFIKESGRKSLPLYIHGLLPSYQGSLNLNLIELLAWACADKSQSEIEECSWHIIIRFYGLVLNGDDCVAATEYIINTIVIHGLYPENRDRILAQLFCLCLAAFYIRDDGRQQTIMRLATAIVIKLSLPEIEKLINLKKKTPVATQSGGYGRWFELVLNNISVHGDTDGPSFLAMDVEGLFSGVKKLFGEKCRILGFDDLPHREISFGISALALVDDDFSMTNKGGVLVKYFKDYHQDLKLVPVVQRKPRAKKLPGWISEAGQ